MDTTKTVAHYSATEAAEYLGVTTETLQVLLDSGMLTETREGIPEYSLRSIEIEPKTLSAVG